MRPSYDRRTYMDRRIVFSMRTVTDGDIISGGEKPDERFIDIIIFILRTSYRWSTIVEACRCGTRVRRLRNSRYGRVTLPQESPRSSRTRKRLVRLINSLGEHSLRIIFAGNTTLPIISYVFINQRAMSF